MYSVDVLVGIIFSLWIKMLHFVIEIRVKQRLYMLIYALELVAYSKTQFTCVKLRYIKHRENMY